MGCHSPADLPRIQHTYVESMQKNLHEVWVAVKDCETGKFIAASNWRVYVNGEGGARDADEPPEWLEGEDLERSKGVISRMNEVRAKSMPGPFVRTCRHP